MPKVLRKLKVKFGSLVDEPANKDARVLLFKRDDEVSIRKPGWDETESSFRYRIREPDQFVSGSFRTVQLTGGVQSVMGKLTSGGSMTVQNLIFSKDKFTKEQAQQWLKDHADVAKSVEVVMDIDVEKLGAKVSRARLKELKSALSALQAALADIEDKDVEVGMSDKAKKQAELSDDVRKGLPEEVQKYLGSLESKITEQAGQIEDVTAKLAEATKTPEQKEQEVIKALPDEARERIEKAEAEAKELRAEIKKERDARVMRDWVAKAAELEALPVKSDEFGAILKRASENELTPEDLAELQRVFKAVDEQLRQSELFKEKGRGGSDSGSDAWEKIEKIAKQKQEADPKLTHAQAVDAAMRENPQLYAEHRGEAVH